MKMWVRPNRFHLSTVLVASVVLTSKSSFAADESNEIGKSAIQEGIATVACSNRRLIDLSGLNYDSCLAKSESVAPLCWDGVQPLIPDLRFGTDDFTREENQKIVLSTLFVIEKCLQAAILLSGNEPDRVRPNEVEEPNAKSNGSGEMQDGELEGNLMWERIIEGARSDYTENRELLDQVSNSLLASDLSMVARDEWGETLAFRTGKDGSLTPVSEGLQDWGEMLATATLQSAVKTDTGVILTGDSEIATDSHEFGVSYVSAHEPSYPQCTPDLRRIPCGSCEVGRSGGHRIILTWYSHDIDNSRPREDNDGATVDFTDRMGKATQCWKDGMSQLGFDSDSPEW